jgi:hypothetical protein
MILEYWELRYMDVKIGLVRQEKLRTQLSMADSELFGWEVSSVDSSRGESSPSKMLSNSDFLPLVRTDFGCNFFFLQIVSYI